MALLVADDDYDTMEQNAELWDAEMRSLFLAETWKDFGNAQTSKEYAKGMLNEYLPTVCLSQVRDRVSPAQDLVVAISDTQPSALCRLMPPARVCQFVNILVSDSALCMITGPKNNPKKHTMEQILQEQSGPDCSCV